MNKFLFCLAACVFMTMASASSTRAQGTATIFGKATDPAGAALPNVTVTATNTETNASRDAATNEGGDYTFTNLPIGTYRVTGELTGFKKYLEQDIRLQVDENRQVNLALEIGDVGETVTITSSSAAQVDTLTGTLREVVDEQRIVNLPLNGRNALQLQRLVPGAGGVVAPGQGQNESLSINGSRPNTNNYTLDGGDNHDPFFNTPSVFPNPDALQEFSVQTSAYSAAFGRNAGAVINAVTRSGTNEFHGSLFEFFRNEKLNARSFFATVVPPFKRNQFGGTLGGPIRRDKTFFFVAYQGWRERSSPGIITATVPTAAQRAGNLSNIATPIIDPVTRVRFTGNIIPAGRLNQAAQRFLQAYVPLPNLPNGLYNFASGQEFDQDQIVTKIDQRFNDANTLTGRFLFNKDRRLEATGNLPGFFANTKYDDYNLTISDTHVFTPTLLNVVRFTYNRVDRRQLSVVPGDQTFADFGVPFVRPFTDDVPPGMSTQIAGYFNAFSRYPLDQFRRYYQFESDLSWTLGAHQLRFGGEYSRSILDREEFFRGDPFLNFTNNNVFTGNALANFLLGRPTTIEQQARTASNIRTNELALYVQDDWKASQRLSLNLGLRWDPYFPLTYTEDRFGQFIPGVQSVIFPTAPRGAVYPGDPGVPRATIKNRLANFAPRVGFAYDPFGRGKTSLRGGYGVFYSQIRQQANNGINLAQPFSIRLTITNSPQGFDNPYATTGNPFPFTPPTGEAAQTYRFTRPVTVSHFDPDFRNSIIQQWNLNAQQEFLGSYIVTAAYVGSKGNHLFRQYQSNPARPGTGSVDARRIYAPDFGPVSTSASVGNSTYHSAQLSLNKRFANGFTLLSSYTFSKFIDDASADGEEASNPFNLAADKAVSDLDVPHRFVASFVYDLPTLQNSSRVVRWLLGGYQINGIVQLQSGTPFS
ncbi:MAG: TonB-dependent receptor, partial [Acidobacteriota bacterium]|nr:TonB-dependent receptor [Acidobacteriota bacterium]